MTDLPSHPVPAPDEAARTRAARQRFFALGLFRLSGALILVFGLAIAREHFSWVQGDKAHRLGVICMTVGFIQMMLVPRLLLRAWATPKDRE